MGVIHRCYRSRLCHSDTYVCACFNSLSLSFSICPSLFLFTHSHTALSVSLGPCQRVANKEQQADNVRGWGNCSPLLPLSLLPPSLLHLLSPLCPPTPPPPGCPLPVSKCTHFCCRHETNIYKVNFCVHVMRLFQCRLFSKMALRTQRKSVTEAWGDK